MRALDPTGLMICAGRGSFASTSGRSSARSVLISISASDVAQAYCEVEIAWPTREAALRKYGSRPNVHFA